MLLSRNSVRLLALPSMFARSVTCTANNGSLPSLCKDSMVTLAGKGTHASQREHHQQLLRSTRGFAAYSLPEPVDDFEGTDDEAHQYTEQLCLLPDRIGFIGAGQMGEALIRGFTAAGVTTTERLCASVRSEERRRAMSSLGVQVHECALRGGAQSVAACSDIVVLGVKPQYMPGVLDALAPYVGPQHLLISIAAGISLRTLEGKLPQGVRVIRVMPNTPSTIRAGASAYVLGSAATEEDGEKAHTLMSAVGLAMEVEERQMDAVTALSGSGPAYVFLAIEALADGGVAAGLPRDKALALAAQTVVGAGRMVRHVMQAAWCDGCPRQAIFERLEDGHSLSHPALLRDRVTSPAGTTIAGLMELEGAGVRGALIRAVKAAAGRAKELNKEAEHT